jgi:hypothetical protein
LHPIRNDLSQGSRLIYLVYLDYPSDFWISQHNFMLIHYSDRCSKILKISCVCWWFANFWWIVICVGFTRLNPAKSMVMTDDIYLVLVRHFFLMMSSSRMYVRHRTLVLHLTMIWVEEIMFVLPIVLSVYGALSGLRRLADFTFLIFEYDLLLSLWFLFALTAILYTHSKSPYIETWNPLLYHTELH